MNVYLVGGAVRDRLLGLPVRERDWVVVGATPDALVAEGYRQVGKDFPVFLHPRTGEEYALARMERKTAPGYHGFEFDTSATVSLEDDLARRDLTINAIAETPDGTLIDPHDGRQDLVERRLRHVSDAFSEDPVRILRVARFAARFAPLGFGVADETMALMREMVEAGEVDALVPERVWAETFTALAGPRPEVFFETLRACGALAIIFPEIERLFGVPQTAQWHPEIDTGVHTMMVLRIAAGLTPDPATRFAALTHDLGKGTTRRENLPAHHGHEKRSVALVKALCTRLRVPNNFRDLALIAAEYHGHVHRAAELRPATILKVLNRTDAFRRPERFEAFLIACEADSRGRKGLETKPYQQADIFRAALAAADAVEVDAAQAKKLSGKEIGAELEKMRVAAIAAARDASERSAE